jgi:hypothetical protein
MTTPEKLSQSFAVTQWIIKKQADGLTHEDTVLQLPFRGNCFNWVLGHIVEHRDQVLEALGEPPILSEAETAVYKTRSEPVTDSQKAVPLARLLSALDEGQERIAAILQHCSVDDLAVIYNDERRQTVSDRIAGLHWHETYHVGQLELLRQLASKNDAII